MNLEALLSQVLQLVSSFTPNVGIFLFVLSFIGEAFVISIPLVFETALLTMGLQLTQGALPVRDFILMMVATQLGRQAGALLLYGISRSGTSFLGRFIARLLPRTLPANGTPGKLLRTIDSISPFGVALGRLLWIRIPLTLLLGSRHRLNTLMLGILISGIIYDIIYVGLGAVVGGTAKPDSGYIVLYLMGGLVAFYAVSFGIRLLYKAVKRRIAQRKERSREAERIKEALLR